MIEVIEIESKAHAKKLAKEGGFDVDKAQEKLAEYYGELLKEKGIIIVDEQ